MSQGEGGEDLQRRRMRGSLIEEVATRGYFLAGIDEASFAAAWREIDLELARLMAEAFAAQGQWEDRLRASLLAGLRYLAVDQSRARFYVVEAVYVSDEIRDRQRVAMARFAEMVDLGRLVEDGQGPPAHIADAVTGAVMHRVHHLVRTGVAESLPFELPQFMYLAVLPYRGVDAAEAELDRPLT